MNDDLRPTPAESVGPLAGAPDDRSDDLGRDMSMPKGTAAVFSGRTPRASAAIRAGMVVGAGLVVALGAAVAMGASPAPKASDAAGQTRTIPGAGADGSGEAVRGFGQFGFGGPAGFGPGRAGELGGGFGVGGPGGQGRHDGPGFGRISVTAISGSNVSLATADGWTRTITLTSTTTIARAGVATTIADLTVGDTVRIAETRNTDGTFAITAIDIVLPQATGMVTAIAADSITIALRDGTSQTIRTTGTTIYHRDPAVGVRTDVTVGAAIVASGTKSADGSLTALSIWVRLPRVIGTVGATTSNTITLTRRDGTTITVHVGSGTTIRIAGLASAGLSDLKAGMGIVVVGTKRADGSIDAAALEAGRPRPDRGHDRPPVIGPEASPSPTPSGGSQG